MPRRIVVLGCGIAGLTVCDELRARGFDGDIVLVDAESEPYDRPPLSKAYLLGTATATDISLAPPSWYADRGIQTRFGTAVTRLRPDDGVVDLADSDRIAGDTFVLALGASPRQLAVATGEAPTPLLLRTRADADAIRRHLVPGAHLAVVGGGLIGSEVTSAAASAGARVTLVEPLDPPLARAVGPELARRLHDQHAEHGVDVVVGSVTGLLPRGDHGVLVGVSGRDQPVAVDAVVAGVGVRPRVDLAREAGLVVRGGVYVNGSYRTSHPKVYAVGDVAAQVGSDDRPLRSEHWDAALRGGRAAAASILGQAPAAPTAPWFWSDRYGWHVEVVGDMRGRQSVVRGTLGEPPFSVLALRDGRLVGAASVNDARTVRAARRLIDAGSTVDPAALADLGTDPRTLR